MSELTSSDYETLLDLVRDRTGLVFRDEQRATTKTSIDEVRQQLNIKDRAEFCSLMRHDELAFDELVEELTVGETYFFRESKHFNEIVEHLIPEIQKVRPTDHKIRCWSAACASGEEAYSLAILLSERQISASILGTDISSQCITKAKRGIYREWSLRGEGAEQARKHLTRMDDSYQLDRSIVSQVKFSRLNLVRDTYPSVVSRTTNMDLILCRNVLIYFSAETVAHVFARLYDTLDPGGWLVTASCDPRPDKRIGFESAVSDNGYFLRKPLAGERRSLRFDPPVKRSSPVWDSLSSSAGETPSSPTVEEPVDAENIDTAPTQTDSGMERIVLTLVETALKAGEYQRVIEITSQHESVAAACVLQLKALANVDRDNAVARAGEFSQRHKLCPDLHYLNAILLMQANRDAEAVKAAQRAVFLDPTLAAAHFLLGSIFKKRGSLAAAKRHFRNVRDLCRSQPEQETVALTEDERAGELAAAAEAQLRNIDSAIGAADDS